MLRLKIRLRFVLINVLSVIVMALILAFAYINGKLIETMFSIVSFYIFRKIFVKQYHSFTALGCALISLIVYFVIIELELSKSESILFSIILTFTVNVISYYVRDYLDNKQKINDYDNKFKKMKSKRLEELTEDELLHLLPNVKYDTIHIVYGYLHKDKGITANEYAYECNISEALMYKYLKKVKDEYKSLVVTGNSD